MEVSREVMKDRVLDKLDMASGKKPRIEATPSAMGQEESMEMKAKTAVVDARRKMKNTARRAKSSAGKATREVSTRKDEVDKAGGRTEMSRNYESMMESSSSGSDAK